jgi:hypothetical protein
MRERERERERDVLVSDQNSVLLSIYDTLHVRKGRERENIK